MAAPVVFLFDVDDTLFDNDAFEADWRARLEEAFGEAGRERYWRHFERLRKDLGYADYLGAVQEYRKDVADDARLLDLSSFLLDYPFADRLFPGALDVVAHLGAHGPTVILSDGDVIFQPRKIQRSGLADAVARRVLVYVHKQERLADVERLYPAAHYVMVDDKVAVLAAMKRAWGPRLTTVFARQGHYAHDPALLADNPPADIAVGHVRDLLAVDVARLLALGRAAGQ